MKTMNTVVTAMASKTEASWASTVSDYILQRRQQTYNAYTSATQNDSPNLSTSSTSSGSVYDSTTRNTAIDTTDKQAVLDSDVDNALFKALFIAVTEALEAGHTVLNMTVDHQEQPIIGEIPFNRKITFNKAEKGRRQGFTVSLYRWQYDLLDGLAAPLYALPLASLAHFEAHQAPESHEEEPVPSIFQLIYALQQLRNPLNLQFNLSSSQKRTLTERVELVNSLFNIMQQLNNTNSDSANHFANRLDGDYLDGNYLDASYFNDSNLHNSDSHDDHSGGNQAVASFQRFINLIEAHPLFSNTSQLNSLSSNNKFNYNNPIIFTVSTTNNNNINNSSSQTSINSINNKLTFWLHRSWQAEHNLATNIGKILTQHITPLEIDIPSTLNEQQAKAVNISNKNAFSIITGGPGTGKTYTVAQLVIALQQAQHASHIDLNLNNQATREQGSRIKFSTDSASLALCAPTGKAAQRMQQSLQAALDSAQIALQLPEAKTIHRLLNIGRDGRPRYHRDNPLGEDIIIVDEASMLGVELANDLVSAIKPNARLILLGDAYQLAAVDAGAVLGDLCRIPSLQPITVQLTQSRRFDTTSAIGQLAHYINQTNVNLDKVWRLLQQSPSLDFQFIQNNQNIANAEDKPQQQNQSELDGIVLKNSLSKNNLNKNLIKKISNSYKPYLDKLKNYQTNIKNIKSKEVFNDLTKELNNFRILTAGHHGQWGDDRINQQLTSWHITYLKLPLGKSPWFHGRPIMVLQNNYELGLFNGDIGICLQNAEQGGRLEVFFENKEHGIAVNLLNDDLITTAYAMTIHKSQGSEFSHVAIAFDNSNARLLSKELIYTAVTRAKNQVTIYSSKYALEKAITTPTQRHTGLGLQFD